MDSVPSGCLSAMQEHKTPSHLKIRLLSNHQGEDGTWWTLQECIWPKTSLSSSKENTHGNKNSLPQRRPSPIMLCSHSWFCLYHSGYFCLTVLRGTALSARQTDKWNNGLIDSTEKTCNLSRTV